MEKKKWIVPEIIEISICDTNGGKYTLHSEYRQGGTTYNTDYKWGS